MPFVRLPDALPFPGSPDAVPAELAATAPKPRPILFCPRCSEGVRAVGGSEHRARFFRHIAASDCVLSEGATETEIHLGAKAIVANALRRICEANGRFAFHGTCPTCRLDRPSHVRLDARCTVSVEQPVGPYVVDVVALHSHGALRLAVEVRHSHPVGDEKFAALAADSDVVVELDAKELFFKGWPAHAVETLRSSSILDCDACIARKKRDERIGAVRREAARISALIVGPDPNGDDINGWIDWYPTRARAQRSRG